MVCLNAIKNLKRCPSCILYEYKSHTKCMDTPLFTPLFTPGPGPVSLERETTFTVVRSSAVFPLSPGHISWRHET